MMGTKTAAEIKRELWQRVSANKDEIEAWLDEVSAANPKPKRSSHLEEQLQWVRDMLAEAASETRPAKPASKPARRKRAKPPAKKKASTAR